MDLFSQETFHLPLPNAEVTYCPYFLNDWEANNYFGQLLEQTPWREDTIRLFGKTYKQPRKTALYGEKGKPYSYSGITLSPLPFTPTLLTLKNAVESRVEHPFSTVLLNLYRDGSDSNGWHSDDERELGKDPIIASLSLGAKRMFHLKHKKDSSIKHRLLLEHGSLLIMGPGTQQNYLHQLPKTKKAVSPRINLTFRTIFSETLQR